MISIFILVQIFAPTFCIHENHCLSHSRRGNILIIVCCVAEVLGAVVSVVIIWVVTGILVYAAIQRVITMEFEVEADTMIIVAALGVVMNIV